MAKLRKHFLGLSIILLATCLLIFVKPANCQSIPSPSTPKLTLKLVDNMFGGEIEIAVQNQAMIPNGHDTPGIFYDFRYKWHEAADWYHKEADPTKWERQYERERGTTGSTLMTKSVNSYYDLLGNSTSHQLDYQVKAINGYLTESSPPYPAFGVTPNDTPVEVVNTSEWSETVTITLPDYKPLNITPAPITTAMPSTPGDFFIPANDITTIKIMLGVIAVSLVVIAVMLFLLIRNKTGKATGNP